MAGKKTQKKKSSTPRAQRSVGQATKRAPKKVVTKKAPAKKTTATKTAPKKVAPKRKTVTKKNALTAFVYDTKGNKKGTITLPESMFGAKWNADMVHQVVAGMQSNARRNTAHAKDRSEVSGGGRKPWRQKGTGRARHGSRRSPIWVGGGVTHGPRNERVFTKKINKKMRARALAAVLSRKLRDNEIIFVDHLTMGEPKTRSAKEILTAFAKSAQADALTHKKKNVVLIALGTDDRNVRKSFQNFGNVLVDEVRNLNPVNLLRFTYVIITEPDKSIAFLVSRIK